MDINKENNFEKIITDKYMTLSSEINAILKPVEYDISLYTDHNGEDMLVLAHDSQKITLKYEVLGVYDSATSIFSWGWDFYTINREKIQLAKKVKSFTKEVKNYIIENSYSDVEYLEKIYYYLSHSIFFINTKKFDDIIKIATFITNSKGVLFYAGDKDERRVNFYIIIDILSQ